ncbi:SAM-dependent methyltransferase [Aurantimonas aggregata]|uniref:SAM-dependent methyltransferase n=1 Tax=Aurantimonas aggregata TaxID=2047720 RepID=A0A6L9MGX3_9HYPH|nr:SAM-dependent methyltransferase [Aurantimonas aggregata]NDV87059.1 SAM-dependent methyltransferase [Aurantimonas aggregata]
MMPALKGARAIARRRVEPPGGLDYFPTPPWATRAFLRHGLGMRGRNRMTVHEPACGEGHMAAVLEETFGAVVATDVFPYGYGGCRDFLDEMFETPIAAGWIITNPPFNKALEFTRLSLERARQGVAMLVRPTFLHGKGRFAGLYRDTPPTQIAYYVERVPMHRGRWEPDGDTLTDYCWLIWRKDDGGALARPRAPLWIPPSRKAMTRKDDAERFGAPRPVPACPLLEVA